MHVRPIALLALALSPMAMLAQGTAARPGGTPVTVAASGLPVPTNVTAIFTSDGGLPPRRVTVASDASRPVTLPPDTYTVTADTVQLVDPTEGNVAYGPRTTLTVSSGQPSRLTFAYVPITGALRYEVTGLPSGVAAEVRAAHAVHYSGVRVVRSSDLLDLNGFVRAIVGSASPKRVSMLLAGDWKVEARFIPASPGDFCATVPEQQVRVDGARTTVVRIAYVSCRR